MSGLCARDGHGRVNTLPIPAALRPVVECPFTGDLEQALIRNRTEEAHG